MKKYSTSPIRDNVDEELEQLYERRRTVENLIHSLQQYSQGLRRPRPAAGVLRTNSMDRRELAS